MRTCIGTSIACFLSSGRTILRQVDMAINTTWSHNGPIAVNCLRVFGGNEANTHGNDDPSFNAYIANEGAIDMGIAQDGIKFLHSVLRHGWIEMRRFADGYAAIRSLTFVEWKGAEIQQNNHHP